MGPFLISPSQGPKFSPVAGGRRGEVHRHKPHRCREEAEMKVVGLYDINLNATCLQASVLPLRILSGRCSSTPANPSNYPLLALENALQISSLCSTPKKEEPRAKLSKRGKTTDAA
ncbi:hypothetical protein I7I51_04362 [Histoplasma capsulatum]|uniref:Uncharacterized protein n=1 Tax=Ajellomyces capsulatus TaxID=5037 RepID=A0A8A1M8V4_AJECA|nr:hypothetical protein I7I51_04362 [Histoplasma capsulatum]